MSLKEAVSKTTIANVCAFIIVVGGFSYGAYKGDTELVKTCLLVALGYLFGYTAKRVT
jgi:phosphoribosylformylglycinamidine (FGAM) synthase-like amidotransferase family enzyme